MSPANIQSQRDETCPLLRDVNAVEEQEAVEQSLPLVFSQLGALCSGRVVDPIGFTYVFPYVNEWMNHLHVAKDPSKIGLYSGVVESAFPLAQLCTIYHWTKLSAKFGRRPVILVGLLGMVLGFSILSVSKSIATIVFSRCLSGLFAGTVAVFLSVLGEMTDSKSQAIAYPIFGLFWPLGVIVGPFIGGTLSDPAKQFPSLFNYPFFRENPYFLPTFVVTIIALFSYLFSLFYLPETLPSKRPKPQKDCHREPSSYGTMDETASDISVSEDAESEPASVKQLLSMPAIRSLTTSGGALSFVATSFDVLFALFAYSPIESGGLAFSAAPIGYSLATAGVLSAGMQILFLPHFLRTFDHAKMYSFFMSLWPLPFMILPLLNVIAINGADEAGLMSTQTNALLWTCIAITLAVSRVASLAYCLNMILIKEHTPSQWLGPVNGLTQLAMCASRAFSPAIVSALFALSIDKNLLGSYLWVIVMTVLCLISGRISSP